MQSCGDLTIQSSHGWVWVRESLSEHRYHANMEKIIASSRMRLWSKRFRCFRFLWANPKRCPRAVATTLVSSPSAGVKDLSNQQQTQGARVCFFYPGFSLFAAGSKAMGILGKGNKKQNEAQWWTPIQTLPEEMLLCNQLNCAASGYAV